MRKKAHLEDFIFPSLFLFFVFFMQRNSVTGGIVQLSAGLILTVKRG